MTVTLDALNRVDHHWAVRAVGAENCDRALEVAKMRLLQAAVGRQMLIDFQEDSHDPQLLERVAMAYELAALEGLNALLFPSLDQNNVDMQELAQAGAFRAYEIRRTLDLPAIDEERIFHILHLAALAYCGERWTDIRRYLREKPQAMIAPSVADANWDRRVLYRLFECWVRLLRKNGWDDLDGVREIIAGLRNDQGQYEDSVLANQDNELARAMAFRLIALYHWAKATESLAIYMLQGEPAGISAELDQHFESGRQAAMAAQDPPLEVLLRWLHVTAVTVEKANLRKVLFSGSGRVELGWFL